MSKIAPGRYSAAQLPIEQYHSQCTDRPSISASGLKMIADCPAKFYAFSELNPNRFERKDTKALDIGKAAHAAVLGEPQFNAHFIVSPYDDFRTKEAREWRDAQTLTVLKAEEFEIVCAMAKAQRASPAVMQAFERGEPEVSLIWLDKETGVHLKSRPDWLPPDPTQHFIADYKSCLTIEPRKLSSDAFKFSYPVQAALQMDALTAVLGIKNPLGICHVVQEKSEPYLADVRMFAPEHLDYGRLIYRRALRTFADCLNSGKWPAYSDSPQYFHTPAWVARDMEELTYDDDGHGPSQRYTARDYASAI